jgi:hypothetical protein
LSDLPLADCTSGTENRAGDTGRDERHHATREEAMARFRAAWAKAKAEGRQMPTANETQNPIERLLQKHLPYEFDMLELTFHLLHSSDDQANETREDRVVSNALIESFWTHARNLIEFFNKPRGDGSKGVASAQDMTDGYVADTRMKQLDQMINVQISHLQYDRPALTQEQLDFPEMDRVRGIIAREVQKFERSLLPTYRAIWKPRPQLDERIRDQGWLKFASGQPSASNEVQTLLHVIVPSTSR